MRSCFDSHSTLPHKETSCSVYELRQITHDASTNCAYDLRATKQLTYFGTIEVLCMFLTFNTALGKVKQRRASGCLAGVRNQVECKKSTRTEAVKPRQQVPWRDTWSFSGHRRQWKRDQKNKNWRQLYSRVFELRYNFLTARTRSYWPCSNQAAGSWPELTWCCSEFQSPPSW